MSVTVGIYTYVGDNKTTLPYPTDDSRTINNVKIGGIKHAIEDRAMVWDESCKIDLKDILENEPAAKTLISFGEIIINPSMNPKECYHFRTIDAPNGKSYIAIEHVTRVQNTAVKAFEKKRKKESLAKLNATAKPTSQPKIEEIITPIEETPSIIETPVIKKTRKPRTPKTENDDVVKAVTTEIEPVKKTRKPRASKPPKEDTITISETDVKNEPIKKNRKARVTKSQPQINPMFFFIMKFGEAVEAYSNLFPEQKELYDKLIK